MISNVMPVTGQSVMLYCRQHAVINKTKNMLIFEFLAHFNSQHEHKYKLLKSYTLNQNVNK